MALVVLGLVIPVYFNVRRFFNLMGFARMEWQVYSQ